MSGRQSDVLINNTLFSSNQATAHGPDVHTNGSIKRLKVRNPTWSRDHIGEEEDSLSLKAMVFFPVALISVTVLFGLFLSRRYLRM